MKKIQILCNNADSIPSYLAASLLLAFAMTVGRAFVIAKGYVTVPKVQLLISFLLSIPLWMAILKLLVSTIEIIGSRVSLNNSLIAKLAPQNTRRDIIKFTSIMLAAWAIWAIAVYPGAMNWDTYYQIWMTYPGNHPVTPDFTWTSFLPNELSDHHPIFDTAIYALFARTSEAITGNWNIGVFLYVVLQLIATAWGFVFTLAYLNKYQTGMFIRGLLYIFCCVFPVIPAFGSTMLKDSTFSMLYIPYLVLIAEIVRTRSSFLNNGKNTFLFILITVLLSLTKKTGVYIVVPTSLALLIAYRRYATQFLSQIIICSFIMFVLLPKIIFPILDVAPGGKQEMLALPFQQTARYVVSHPTEITDAEKQAIDNVLNYSTLQERYLGNTADYVKNFYRTDATRDDLIEYFKVYITQGLRHPETYASAFLGVVSPFFSPGIKLGILMNTGDVEHNGSPLVWQPHQLDSLRNALGTIYTAISNTPVMDILFGTFTYTLIIPLLFFLRLQKLDESMLLLTPIVLSFCGCMVSPVFDTRYILPFIYQTPLLLGIAFETVSAKHAKS